MRNKLATAALLGSAFAVAAGGTAFVNAATDSSEPPAKVQAVSPEISARFAVLRKAPTDDRVSRSTQNSAVLADTGINGDLARTAAPFGADDVALVTPSRGGVCVGTKALGVLTCGNADNALKGQVVGAVICSKLVPADKVTVLGTFPDEVKTLKATLSDGSTTTYPVQSNVFVRLFAKTAPVPLKLSFVADGATRTTTTSLPADDLGC